MLHTDGLIIQRDIALLIKVIMKYRVRVVVRPTHPLLGDGLEVSLGLLLFDSTGSLGLTIWTALGDRPLAATTAHAYAVDHKALNKRMVSKITSES